MVEHLLLKSWVLSSNYNSNNHNYNPNNRSFMYIEVEKSILGHAI